MIIFSLVIGRTGSNIALSGIGQCLAEFSEPVLQYRQVFSKVGVYRSVHISTRGFVSAQYKCTEFLDPVTMRICPEKILLTKR